MYYVSAQWCLEVNVITVAKNHKMAFASPSDFAQVSMMRLALIAHQIAQIIAVSQNGFVIKNIKDLNV